MQRNDDKTAVCHDCTVQHKLAAAALSTLLPLHSPLYYPGLGWMFGSSSCAGGRGWSYCAIMGQHTHVAQMRCTIK
jgi:hypothetical protein